VSTVEVFRFKATPATIDNHKRVEKKLRGGNLIMLVIQPRRSHAATHPIVVSTKTV